jgi:hypothetical protein
MRTRILDLDHAIVRQPRLAAASGAASLPLADWGPSIRQACSFSSFERFQAHLARQLDSPRESEPMLYFVGSGDFHHVSLALLRRLSEPCNLLVLDNHPDWMRRVPLLHCGTWLYHAARLPHVRRIFHLGGDVDFDNAYRWLAPWPLLRVGKIVVLPARRHFRAGAWSRIPHEPLRARPEQPIDSERLVELLWPFRFELASLPLYISLDKDVLQASEAAVNWDSGHLLRDEVFALLRLFLTWCGGLAGMDVVGDWSPVRVEGPLRRFLSRVEHPAQADPLPDALARNETFNLALLDLLFRARAARRAARAAG